MLTILPMDPIHLKTSYAFLVESFTISFGPNKSAWPNGLGNYDFVRYSGHIERLLKDPAHSFFSVWDNDQLIGQIELSNYKEIPDCGYVSFYYLKPEYRNKGLGQQLDHFAITEFKKYGYKKARLTVSEINKPGQRFYQKNGWRPLGPDPERPLGITMEKDLYPEA